LRSVIQRGRQPLQETQLQLTVHGIFSLPESWKSKVFTLFLIFIGWGKRSILLRDQVHGNASQRWQNNPKRANWRRKSWVRGLKE